MKRHGTARKLQLFIDGYCIVTCECHRSLLKQYLCCSGSPSLEKASECQKAAAENLLTEAEDSLTAAISKHA